ncbi:MAG: DUF3822 family protein [Bacteroidales bacterium]|nr:DUF3822 family protein [Bacteroidales bacterium]
MQNIVKELYCIKDTVNPELNDHGKKILSIELSLDGFSYCVLDAEKFRYIALESFALEGIKDLNDLSPVLDEMVREKLLLTGSYQRISFALNSADVSLIPADYFSYSEKNTYLNFSTDTDQETETRVDKLNNLSAFAVYAFPKQLLHKVNFLFPACRIRHISTSLIENILYMVRYGRVSPQLVLHVQKGNFQILYFEGNNLSFYNSYRYQTWDDLFYYLFFVLEQLSLDAEKLDMMLFGEVGIEGEFYKKVKLYFKSFSFGPRNDLYKYSEAFDNIPHHFFYNLLSLNACG